MTEEVTPMRTLRQALSRLMKFGPEWITLAMVLTYISWQLKLDLDKDNFNVEEK